MAIPTQRTPGFNDLEIIAKKIKILHLEDLNSDAILVSKTMQKGNIASEIMVVETRDGYIEALNNFLPDIILADHSLPCFNAHEALHLLAKQGLKIPFILITGSMTDEFAVDMINRGADDYILKDRMNRLPAAIQNALEKFRLERERKLFLDELIKRENRYRALVENSADATVILSAEGKAIYASATVSRMLGYTEKEALQLDLLSLAHPDDASALADVWQQVLKYPGVPIKGHTGRMKHKDGTWRWLEATVTNMLHDHAINGIVDNFRDVTDKKQTEEHLANNENKFRRLIENGSDGIAILTPQGKPVYVSPSIKNILGYSHNEALELGLFALANTDDTSILIATMQQALKNPGLPVKGEATRMRHKNGSWRWIDGVLTNMLHDPAIAGIVDNFRDVTEAKLAEEKIILLNRLYAFLSQINQTIVHAVDEQGVYKEACRIACETGGFGVAWIGMFDEKNQTITLVESCGIPAEEEKKMAKIICEPNGRQSQVLSSGVHYLCNDLQDASVSDDWEYLGPERGFGSSIILPLKKGGNVTGTFNLYASQQHFFTPEEVALLVEAAGDIDFSMDIFEEQAKKVRADELLQHKEFLLNQAQSIAHLGSWELDLKTAIGEWSPETCRIYGLNVGDFKHSYESWMSFLHPEDKDYVLQLTNNATATQTNADIYHRIIRRDGTIRHLHTQFILQYDANGEPASMAGVAHDVTEMKEAQDALRESESNLQAIFNSASEGFLLCDINGNLKSFNTKAKEITYQNVAKTINIGDNLIDLINDSKKENHSAAFGKVLSGETVRYDYPVYNQDGELRWFTFTLNPVYAGDNITGLTATFTDVTVMKQAEESLRRSENNLHAIIENTDAFIYSLDTNLRYITFNQRLYNAIDQFYGIKIQPGFAVIDLLSKNSSTELHEWQEAYLMGLKGNIVNFEKKFLIDGVSTYSAFSIHPIWENVVVIRLSCFVRDITKEKQAAEEIRFKANLLNTITQAAVAIDLTGVVKYWNKAAEDIYGWSFQEVAGKNIIDITPTDASREEANHIMELLMQGKSWSGEFRAKRKDQTDFPALVSNSPIFDEHDKLAGIIGISSDITEKKKMEELLDIANRLARIGSYEINFIQNSLYWSPITKEIHEVGNDFIPSLKTAINFYKPGLARASISHAIDKAIEKRIPINQELEIITAKGNERWVKAIGEAEFENGVCIRITGSLQDIDKIKRAELDALKSAEEKNIILESIGDAFFAVNNQWEVTYWNKHAERMLDGPKEKVIGKIIWSVIPVDIGSETYKKYYEAVETNQIVHFEDYYPLNNKWYQSSVYPSLNGLSVYLRDITTEKLSAKSLKQSEFRYRQIVETAQEGIWMIDEKSRSTFVNRKMCEILEYAEDEIIGKEIFHFMCEDAVIVAAETIKKQKAGITETTNLQFITKSGKKIWTNISANPIFDEEEIYKGALGMVSDITDKLIAQDAVIESEHKYRQLSYQLKLESIRLNKAQAVAKVGSWENDLLTSKISWSEETYRIFETSPDKFNGSQEAFFNFIHPDDRKIAEETFLNSLKKTSPNSFEHLIITANGTEKCVLENWEVILNEAGIPIRSIGTCQDITERKKADASLVQSEAKLKAAQRIAAVGSWEINFSDNKHEWSDEFYRILGIEKGSIEPSAEALLSFIHPEDVERASVSFASTQHLQFDSSLHFRFFKADGTLSYAVTEWKFEHDGNHKSFRLAGILRDVTKQTKADLERTKMIAEITQRNKDLEQFSYIVSHNLHAPLANIIGMDTELDYPGHNNEVKAMFKKQLSLNVKRLDEVITDLNSILQLRTSVGEKAETVIFSQLVEDIRLSIQNIIEINQVQLIIDFSGSDSLLTIKTYMYSIFYNLISNSIKYRQPGLAPLIEIKSEKKNSKLCLVFKDNGQGIDLARKGDQVFGLYKRFHTSIEGKGMGLFMVKTQVETLGGKIAISSEVNQGTEFTIEF